MKLSRSISWIALWSLVSGAAFGAVPAVMNYQGRLTDNTPEQNPVTATLPMEFRIYGSPTTDDLVWSESWSGGVDVTNGIFNVLLGSNGSPISNSVFSGAADRYLEIMIDGETLSPRQQIGAVGYAYQAGHADDLDCFGCVGDAELDNDSDFTFNGQVEFNQPFAQKFISKSGGEDKLEWWAEPDSSYLYHRPADSFLLVDDATGNWGIDTTEPPRKFTVIGDAGVTSTFDVGGELQAFGDVDVTGTVLAGLERVSATEQTLEAWSNCNQGGGWTCYGNWVEAVCPSGKGVLGGGCECSGITDSICYGYPTSYSYRCFNVDVDPLQSFTAWVVCARIGD